MQFLYTNTAKLIKCTGGKRNVLSLLFNNVNVETNIMKCGTVSQQLKTCFVNFWLCPRNNRRDRAR